MTLPPTSCLFCTVSDAKQIRVALMALQVTSTSNYKFMDVINDTSKTKAGLLSAAIQMQVTLCCAEIITLIETFKNIQIKASSKV